MAGPTQSTPRYNPHLEPENLKQVIAANWELLRRIPVFQDVAKKWIASREFRFQHVSERTIYKDNVFARCALCWMLTSEQRHVLAQYEMQRRFFFWGTANYGPIIVQEYPERLTTRLKKGIDDLFEVKPDLNAGGMLRVDQPWPTTPPKFRSQFSSIFDNEDLQEIVLNEHGLTLARIGNYLLSDKPISSEERIALGRYLFQLGDHFRRLSKDFKIAGIAHAGRAGLWVESVGTPSDQCITACDQYDAGVFGLS